MCVQALQPASRSRHDSLVIFVGMKGKWETFADSVSVTLIAGVLDGALGAAAAVLQLPVSCLPQGSRQEHGAELRGTAAAQQLTDWHPSNSW